MASQLQEVRKNQTRSRKRKAVNSNTEQDNFPKYPTKFETIKNFEAIFGTKIFKESEVLKELDGFEWVVWDVMEEGESNAVMKDWHNDLKTTKNYEEEDEEYHGPVFNVNRRAPKVKRDVSLVTCDDVPGEIRKMNYFEPVADNIQGFEELQMTHVPYVSDDTDDLRVSGMLHQHYPSGVHGYNMNYTDMNDESMFYLMLHYFPNVKSKEQADLFYYMLYRLYPSFATQVELSEMFPKLVRMFEQDPDKQRELLKMEYWKPDEVEVLQEVKKPPSSSCSKGNFFRKYVRLPSCRFLPVGTECENCYKRLSVHELSRISKHLYREENGLVECFIKKDTEIDSDFWTALFLGCKYAVVEDFCAIANKFNRKSCSGWFKTLLEISENPTDNELKIENSRKNFKSRNDSFQRFYKKFQDEAIKDNDKILTKNAEEQELDMKTVVASFKNNLSYSALGQCCHFGSCGPENPDCSCAGLCSPSCQCDVNCSRRFPGCDCSGKCIFNCNCHKFGWECNSMCGCVKYHKGALLCKNSEIQRGVCAHVTVKKSLIENAGNGAFVDERVKKYSLVGEYVGEIISESESNRRGCVDLLKISYTYGLPTGGTIDAMRAGNAMRFLNNSKKPNCMAQCLQVDGVNRIGFFAMRDLKKGEELTINYAYGEEGEHHFFTVAPENRAPKKMPKKMPNMPNTSKKSVSNQKTSKSKGNSSESRECTCLHAPNAKRRKHDDYFVD